MIFFFVGSPSPSKGLEPNAARMVPSSITVTSSEAIWVSSLFIKNDAPLYKEYPEMADDKFRSREAAISGSKTMGTSQVFTFFAPSRLNTRCAAFSPTFLGDSRRANFRSDEHHWSRCICPLDW